jgi:hypothetical protein
VSEDASHPKDEESQSAEGSGEVACPSEDKPEKAEGEEESPPRVLRSLWQRSVRWAPFPTRSRRRSPPSTSPSCSP